MEESKEKYIKKFDEWNTRKKILNERVLPDSFFFLEREIWWTSIGVNIGREIDGKHDNFERPVLILKKFTEDTFMGLSISTQDSDRPTHTMLHGNQKRFVSLEQIKYMSIQRLLRLISRMDEAEFLLVRDKITNIFS